ncbi:MAG: nucleotidyltransferase domain-containing protein [Nanoarchaeota archaeon]|nr:nucleotidyltransferase domain-containing protein [Nanoarchaeota archaeon]
MDNELKILLHLGKNMRESFTMHQLSRLLKIPYATFHRTIENMRDLLIIREVGKAKTITINKTNPVIRSYLAIASYQETKDYLTRHRLIKILAKDLNSNDVVILFGSHAKGTQRKDSDIDLMIINKRGDRSISFSHFELLFRKEINPIFITPGEFRLMLGETQENVGNLAVKHHIVLNNPETFWRHALRG